MKNRKDSPISFGITLTSSKRSKSKNFDRYMEFSTVCRENDTPGKTEQVSIYEFDFPRKEMPPVKLPFTPDMFNCGSMRLPTFPPRKMTKKEKRIHKVLEQLRSRTAASHHTSGKSSAMTASAAWEFFKVVCAGVFVALKYTAVAISIIITIGCFMCAGRQTREVKYRW